MNDFQANMPDTAARTLAERHIEGIRQQGGMFVEAVRVTRMPMLVTDATLPGNPITFANNAFIELSGYTIEELLGQDPHFMNGERTDPISIRRYQAAIVEGRDETLEILQYRKDGTPFRAMLFASPLSDGQGTVTNHFLSYLDITRRFDAEESLRVLTLELEARVAERTLELETAHDRLAQLGAERERLLVEVNRHSEASLMLRNRALGAIAQGVLITDPGCPDNPIIYVNPAFERLTGYAADEVLGRNCRFLQGSGTDLQAVARVRVALQAGRSIQETVVNYRKDGTSFINELTISPILAPDGRVTHFVGIQSDVTERQRLEENLRQAQKMEAVGQLTGGIAHDFNNLLQVILGNAEILIDDAPSPEQSRSLSVMIREAAESGAELTRHLLVFGRRQALRPARLRLDHVVHGITPLLRRTIGEHIELRTEFAESTLSALTDRALLESAVLNLVVNARDAMPQGGTLSIRAGQRKAGLDEGQLLAGQDVVFVTVSDTGTGMSPEVMARVFEPFFTTKEVGKGSGLGLAMVYGFAQQIGGHVSIKSAPEQGTSVTIALPAIVNAQVEAATGSAPIPLSKGHERILIVEDEPTVLRFVAAQLLSLGYEVTVATDGPDALAVLRADRAFDLLLTDLMLPNGMSGVDLSRSARNVKPDLKVIFTSGYSEEVFQQHGKLDDGTPLLRKPYKRRQLAETLRGALDHAISTRILEAAGES
jgi:PAS domain S-box-containing protein